MMVIQTLCAVGLPLAFAAPAPINPVTGDPIYLPAAGNPQGDQSNYIQKTFLPSVTVTIITSTGALSLLFVIISGVQILIAFGNEEKITAAKKTLTWALVGLVIAILSYAIVQIIVSIQFAPKT